MAERAYTVSELDDLRRVLRNKWLYGSYLPDWEPGVSMMSRSYMPGEQDAAVEQMARTHMLAGHTSDDLLADERERQEKWAAAREAARTALTPQGEG